MTASGSFRTTTPTWNQPWACKKCHKYGVYINRPQPGKEWLRAMARGIDQLHREASPLCPFDISSKRDGEAVMVIGRPWRHGSRSGTYIWAEGPGETPQEAQQRGMRQVWPPWMEGKR
jgi:hypothetical protein